MKISFIIFIITGFLIVNVYHDGKYMTIIRSWKKYYQMGIIGFLGLSLYLFIKKHPSHSRNMMQHAAQIVKYIPVDKDSSDFINPLLNLTSQSNNMFNQGTPQPESANFSQYGGATPQQKRMMNSGKKATKRSVSETKKKFVAAQQSWCCGNCKKQLPAWFEVDHKVRLEYGGSNHVDNLVALCRDCHGQKTAMETL
jgi:hypothetical protein